MASTTTPRLRIPYDQLRIDENARRGTGGPREYEVLDTGVFDGDRYFDVTEVDYAKSDDARPSMLMRDHGCTNARRRTLTHAARAAAAAWFAQRPGPGRRSPGRDCASLPAAPGARATRPPGSTSTTPGSARSSCWPASCPPDGSAPSAGCSARTRPTSSGSSPASAPLGPDGPYPKDGINDHVVGGGRDGEPGARSGNQVRLLVPRPDRSAAGRDRRGPAPACGPGRPARVCSDGGSTPAFGPSFDVGVIGRRKSRRRTSSTQDLHPGIADPDGRTSASVMRQAFAGMLWCKQYCTATTSPALARRRSRSSRPRRPRPAKSGRNARVGATGQRLRHHVDAGQAWEYPWYRIAWDLAFHTVSLAHDGPRRSLSTSSTAAAAGSGSMHPNGASCRPTSGSFSDVNPPVAGLGRARACLRRSSSGYSPDGATLRLPVPHLRQAAASTSPGG